MCPCQKTMDEWYKDEAGGQRHPSMGKKDLGTKCLPMEPAPPITPIGTPVQQDTLGEGGVGRTTSGPTAAAHPTPVEPRAVSSHKESYTHPDIRSTSRH